MNATASADSNSKRRRGLGVVTPNACTECRKKRAKCDGNTPCGRCVSQGVECVYEVPVRQSKEHMRSEIEALRTQQKQNERILAALVAGDTSEQVLDELRNGESVERIAAKLDQSPAAGGTGGNNITTFSRINDQSTVAGPSRRQSEKSIGSSPSSILPYGEMGMQPQQVDGSWQRWGSGSGPQMGFQDAQVGLQPDDMMKWEPDVGALPQAMVGTWHHHSNANSTPDSTTHMARGQGQETILGPPFGMEEASSHNHPNYNESWTTVTSDGAFVEHLMALYFCWEYPTFASLSKEHFLDDFKNGNRRHCSSLLVNALLALGCRFSTQTNARTIPDDPNTAGDHFFAEALRELNAQDDRHILTTIQALGLMAIREASCGRSSESIFYAGQSIRLAMEMGLHLDIKVGTGKEAEIEHAVRSATFWGAFSLDQAWSLSIGRLPHFSRDIKLVTKPAIIEHIEASSWIPYTDDGGEPDKMICMMTNHRHEPGAPLEKSCTQPSNVRSVYKTFCELSEIVHRSLYALYAPGSRVTSRDLLNSYTEYLRWYEAIPTTLRLGQNFTPAVLFAHMYYHFAILLLFRPFIKLSIIGSGVSPRDMCSQAADAISTLVNSYSKLYTLRRTPSFVPYFVLTSSITHLVTLGSGRSGPDAFRMGIESLKEMRGAHGFADKALRVLKWMVGHWEIDIDGLSSSSPENSRSPEEEEQSRRLRKENDKLCRPSSTSLNMFCPNISGDDVLLVPLRGVKDEEGGAEGNRECNNLLFWPFPLQGRPLLDVRSVVAVGGRVGEGIEASGFKVLED